MPADIPVAQDRPGIHIILRRLRREVVVDLWWLFGVTKPPLPLAQRHTGKFRHLRKVVCGTDHMKDLLFTQLRNWDCILSSRPPDFYLATEL